jgi:eukaryotic-like serine/threonine-protein kinase
MKRIEPGTMLQERYRIEAILSQNRETYRWRTFQEVYRAYDVKLARFVAIQRIDGYNKPPLPEFDADILPLTLLDHPNLPRITDYFQVDGSYFWGVEFVPGKNLDQLLAEREEAFSVKQVLDWADSLLGTLEYLHARGIIHCSVRPSTLVPTGEGQLRLLSFCLPRVLEYVTSTGCLTILGSDPYARAMGMRPSDLKVEYDIYSLGATLYHLLTKQPPLSFDERLTYLLAKQPIPSATELNPLVPGQVFETLEWMMELDGRKCPKTIAEVRAALFAS